MCRCFSRSLRGARTFRAAADAGIGEKRRRASSERKGDAPHSWGEKRGRASFLERNHVGPTGVAVGTVCLSRSGVAGRGECCHEKAREDTKNGALESLCVLVLFRGQQARLAELRTVPVACATQALVRTGPPRDGHDRLSGTQRIPQCPLRALCAGCHCGLDKKSGMAERNLWAGQQWRPIKPAVEQEVSRRSITHLRVVIVRHDATCPPFCRLRFTCDADRVQTAGF